MKLEVMDNGLSEYELVDETGETVAYMAVAGDVERARHIAESVNYHYRILEALRDMVDLDDCSSPRMYIAAKNNALDLLDQLQAGKGGE